MELILQKLGLQKLFSSFTTEKISPDIVCKLSVYELKCLGVVNRCDLMNLRIECSSYCCEPPRKTRLKPGPPEFQIPRLLLQNLMEIGFKVSEIANLLSVSESTVYRRMRIFGLRKLDFSIIDDVELEMRVKETIRDFPKCGETMLNQILRQQNIKVFL